MGIKYLWDTNTAIYYLQKQFSPAAERLMDAILQEFQPAISAITEIELLCWKTATEQDLKVVKDFIEDSIVFELEAAIKNKTVEIRRHQKIKLPDAVIAATALDHNLTLITRNTDDFKSVPGLNVFNPWSL